VYKRYVPDPSPLVKARGLGMTLCAHGTSVLLRRKNCHSASRFVIPIKRQSSRDVCNPSETRLFRGFRVQIPNLEMAISLQSEKQDAALV
jgi:hypothetical protein